MAAATAEGDPELRGHRSDRGRRGAACGAAPAHEGARRAPGGFGPALALAVPAPPAQGRPPLTWLGRGPREAGAPAGAEPRKRAERLSLGARHRSTMAEQGAGGDGGHRGGDGAAHSDPGDGAAETGGGRGEGGGVRGSGAGA